MPARPLLVASKTVEPAPFGLLETISTEALPPHGGLAGIEYDTEFCGVAKPWVAPCVDPGVTTKDADDGIEQAFGVPTPLYHLFSCRLVGGVGESEAKNRAERALDLGASRALEEGFGQTIGAVATDITPGGTAVSALRALALLEQYGGQNYGGQRVIHVSLDVATILISLNLIHEVGGNLETHLGSLVIAGPGYGGLQVPSAPAANAQWMYATGAVRVWAGETVATPLVLDTPYTNEFKALAERIYVPTYECFAAAVEVNMEA
jgi:hypothetical protein